MTQTTDYRSLTNDEIETLTALGCSCADWSSVQVAGEFRAVRVRNTHFSGDTRLGGNDSTVTGRGGVEKICGVFDAYLHNCTVADGVRIANVGGHIANYDIGAGACIEDVGTIETRPGATFGNGVEIEPLNEGGGREITLFNRLDSQFAHLMCLRRYRPKLTDGLAAIANSEAAKARSDRGTIGAAATVRHVRRIVDVNLGNHAVVDGAASLVGGTVLSSADAPTTIGTDVQADEFIIAEGARVVGGSIVSKTLVGQGCQIGKHFSSEGSLFFANCEGFHGEACSVFAGPYTVTHHKSTLLIAGLFSFYNAGSGTNQSNHLYKLGPVHEGKLERGCKTGSFSYMMWPCRVGPFSVVLGKHTRTFDTADFPFSYLDATPEGRCQMTPGFNLTTVGTFRDGAKWPARDRRKGDVRRDRITFDVFSPLTVGRMMTGSRRMGELYDKTARSVDTVSIGGTDVKRVILKTGQKFYRSAIQMYVLDKAISRAERAIAAGAGSVTEAFAVSSDAVFSEEWVDVGGQLMPRDRLDDLCRAVEEGRIADLDALNAEWDKILASYDEDEWAWVRWAHDQVFETKIDDATPDDLVEAADQFNKARGKFLKMVLHDASKEFDVSIRTGFGHGGSAEDIDADFVAVRGDYESNKFVAGLQGEISALSDRLEKFKQAAAKLSA